MTIDPPEPPPRDRWVRRVTVNLNQTSADALARLPGRTQTDALNKALRLAVIVQGLVVDGKLTAVRPDGTPIEVHIV